MLKLALSIVITTLILNPTLGWRGRSGGRWGRGRAARNGPGGSNQGLTSQCGWVCPPGGKGNGHIALDVTLDGN
jgi:hypothetical protein